MLSIITRASIILVGVGSIPLHTQIVRLAVDSALHTSVTLYSDAAIIRQRFNVPVVKDSTQVRVQGLPESIDGNFLSLQPLTPGALLRSLRVLASQSTSASIIQQYIGKVVYLRRNGDLVEGILLTAPSSFTAGEKPCHVGAVIQLRTGELLIHPCGDILLPPPTHAISTTTTIEAMLITDSEGRMPIDLVYRCGGIHWHANYTAIITDDRALQFEGYANLLNKTQTRFYCNQIQLVAGAVHMESSWKEISRYRSELLTSHNVGERKAIEPIAQQLDEYHLYTLPYPVTIEPSTSTIVLLRSHNQLPYKRRLVVHGYHPYYGIGWDEDTADVPVNNVLEVINRSQDSLALPAGNVRVWRRDAQGITQFIGEDAIEHTPVGESFLLTLGRAIDVRATRRAVRTQHLSDRVAEHTVEYILRNHKPEQSEIRLVEDFSAEWEILDTSHTFVKRTARRAEWNVVIPSKHTVTVRYTVRLRW